MAGKKNVPLSKDTILSDSDDSQDDFGCEICGISFNDAKTYDNHMLGKKHAKKVTELKLKAKNEKGDKEGDIEDEEDSDDAAEIHCKICDKDFTGYVSYAAHVKGSGHAKNVKKQKLKRQLGDRPEVLKEDNDSDEDDMIPKPYARCSTCQKEFGGPESFKMHVKSATHLKKIQQAKALQDLKKDEGEHSDGEEVCSKCKVCSKSFSGVVPYKIHMQSNVHKKNMNKIKIAEEIKEYCDTSGSAKGYICKECKKTFTDPLAFKNHLENNSHEKLKAKNALSEFLHDHPEIVYVALFDKEENESEEDESDSSFYLICKLCHLSFTGPESAQDHVKSKKHITTKKEKRMQKFLKEQETMSSPTSYGRTDDTKPPEEKKQVNGSKNDEKSIDEFEVL